MAMTKIICLLHQQQQKLSVYYTGNQTKYLLNTLGNRKSCLFITLFKKQLSVYLSGCDAYFAIPRLLF